MAGYGVPEADIAGVSASIRRRSASTTAQELDHGHVKANAKVAENLYRKATGDGREAVIAAIFWLKTRAGWKETTSTNSPVAAEDAGQLARGRRGHRSRRATDAGRPTRSAAHGALPIDAPMRTA